MLRALVEETTEKSALEAYLPAFYIGGGIAALLIIGGLIVFGVRIRTYIKDQRSLPQGNRRTADGIAMERKLHMSRREG